MAKKTIDTETTTIMEYGHLVEVPAKEASENKNGKAVGLLALSIPTTFIKCPALSYMVNLGLDHVLYTARA